MAKFSHLALFMLKTVYFSPVNNPVYYCQLMAAGIFFVGGSLNKHETVLFLLLAALSHRLMPALSFKRGDESGSPHEIIAKAIAHLPVKSTTIYGAALAAGSLSVVIPLSLCYYAGTRFETPPTIISVCPTTLKTIETPAGAQQVVEGIVASGHRFLVPVVPSLLFGHCALEPVVLKERVPATELHKRCPLQNPDPDALFSGTSVFVPPEFYSPVLAQVRHENDVHLVLLVLFAALFFFYDGMCVFQKRSRSTVLRWSFFTVDSVVYFLYLALWGMLVIEVLFPGVDMTFAALPVVSSGMVFRGIVGFAVVVCMLRMILPFAGGGE